MMIPNFPTDNLYKFLALVGTIIVIGSVYIPYIFTSELEKQASSVTYKIEKMKIEMDYSGRKLQAILQITNNSIKINTGKFNTDSSRIVLYYSEKELKDLLSESMELQRKDMLGVSELKHYNSVLRRLIDEVKFLNDLSDISIVLGIILSFWGYYQWYYKIHVRIPIKDEIQLVFQGISVFAFGKEIFCK